MKTRTADVVYEGVLVGELLKRAGVAARRGSARQRPRQLCAWPAPRDGYQVVFSLAELDPGFTTNDIIVADTIDGKPLFAYQGPFRIVAPKDTRARGRSACCSASTSSGSRSTADGGALPRVRRCRWAVGALSTRVPAQEALRVDAAGGFPPPSVPADNPMSDAKVELGRHLFYDTRLSGNGTQSCASCHEQARAFTDGRARSVGSTGQVHPRGSMSLVNVAYAQVLTWANPDADATGGSGAGPDVRRASDRARARPRGCMGARA